MDIDKIVEAIPDWIDDIGKSGPDLFADHLVRGLKRARNRISELEAEVAELERQISEKQEELSPIEQKVEAIDAQISELESQIQDCEKGKDGGE